MPRLKLGLRLDKIANSSKNIFPSQLYQVWNGVPDSPLLTSDYPYQILFFIFDHIALLLSNGKWYVSGTKLVSSGSVIFYDRSGGVGDWTFLANFNAGQEITSIDALRQANEDVYTDNTLTTVYFAKTTT